MSKISGIYVLSGSMHQCDNNSFQFQDGLIKQNKMSVCSKYTIAHGYNSLITQYCDNMIV